MYNGSWSLPDDVMRGVFETMQTHKIEKVLFYDDYVFTPDQFLTYMKHPTNNVYVMAHEKEQVVDGIAWLNTWGPNYAFAHFAFFPWVWGKKTLKWGRKMLGHWFSMQKDGYYIIDVVLGKIPNFNEKAIDYTKRLGLTIMGSIPDLKLRYGDPDGCGATFMYITRKDFYNGR
jgi:hypothetical protein